ncbi:tetrahydromethanopterin:alpha-L-glutamate ligase [Methanomethylovorans sp.]|uniref:tetrahydromethanopterin:alpha-L-glutamate ligase n=1 Tax=Methanomethylovorans sp. TaxID=2758717 RepID=UPI000A7452C0|nr:tetrahydromethanopterin:alpha-L-glutamate ligase [Methanomethylovorans sp.]
MKLGIAVTDPHDWTAAALLKAAVDREFETYLIDLRHTEVVIEEDVVIYCQGLALPTLDALVVRDVGAGPMEGVSFRFDVLRQLEMQGTLILNSPEAIRNAANKYHTTYLLAKAKLPVPATFSVQNKEKAIEMITDLWDVVVKPVFGYKGKGIIRIRNGKMVEPKGSISPVPWKHQIAQMIDSWGMLYIQEFIENQGRDIRAFVVNGKVLGSIYRSGREGHWINNLSQGGTSSPCCLSHLQERICIEAAEAVGTVFAGVDLIEGLGGTMVLEVNGTPSGAGIYSSCGVNVAGYILDYILSRSL